MWQIVSDSLSNRKRPSFEQRLAQRDAWSCFSHRRSFSSGSLCPTQLHPPITYLPKITRRGVLLKVIEPGQCCCWTLFPGIIESTGLMLILPPTVFGTWFGLCHYHYYDFNAISIVMIEMTACRAGLHGSNSSLHY